LSRPRPCMGCSAWEWVSDFLWVVMYCARINIDMDMSYGRWVSKIWCVSMRVRALS
jgi:hypothetical protein